MSRNQPKAPRRTLPVAFNSNDSISGNDKCPPYKRSRTAPTAEAPTRQTSRQLQCLASYRIADQISKIQVMKLQESTTYKPLHYLDHTAVTADDRRGLCQWGFEIMNACNMKPDIAVIAIGYFDRFLSNRGLRVVEACLANQREFQLAFVTCVVIALKGRGGMEVKPYFVAETMCEGMYLSEEIIGMELEILRTLGWLLNGPTSKDFIEHFMELLPIDADDTVASSLYEAAIKKTEVSLLDYQLALECPSSLALASIASLLRSMSSEESNAICASSWMGRIGFVMGAASIGQQNQGTEVNDEDTSLLTRLVSDSDDDASD